MIVQIDMEIPILTMGEPISWVHSGLYRMEREIRVPAVIAFITGFYDRDPGMCLVSSSEGHFLLTLTAQDSAVSAVWY